MKGGPAACLVLWWAVAMCGAAAADAKPGIAEISAQLERNPVLRADFVQERKLRLLDRPLISQGRMLFVSGQGVLWQVVEPLPAELLVTPEEIMELKDGAMRPAAMGDHPIFRALADVFVAALSGDLDQLQESFELMPVKTAQGWRLTLTPRVSDLKDMISEIVLDGGSFVEEIRIAETSGDSTVIQLGDFRTQPAELRDAERAYFAE